MSARPRPLTLRQQYLADFDVHSAHKALAHELERNGPMTLEDGMTACGYYDEIQRRCIRMTFYPMLLAEGEYHYLTQKKKWYRKKTDVDAVGLVEIGKSVNKFTPTSKHTEVVKRLIAQNSARLGAEFVNPANRLADYIASGRKGGAAADQLAAEDLQALTQVTNTWATQHKIVLDALENNNITLKTMETMLNLYLTQQKGESGA